MISKKWKHEKKRISSQKGQPKHLLSLDVKLKIVQLFAPLDIRILKPTRVQCRLVAEQLGVPMFKVYKHCYDKRNQFQKKVAGLQQRD